MSYVSISKPVRDRIVQAARETRTEIIGLLLGRLEDDTIIIEDSTTHEFSSEPHRVTLPASSIAVIADKLVSGRLKGTIVGWYHSHTEGGLFFSDTDISTQKKLQQFSSLVTGLVVDSSNGEVGYFRVTPGTNSAVRLRDENIITFTDPNEALPRRPTKPAEITATPTVEVRRRTPTIKAPTRRVILCLVFVLLVVSIGTLAAVLYSYRASTNVTTVNITSSPVLEATIGTPVRISANVTASGRNVTLVYGEAAVGASIEVPMAAVAAGEYAYVIPGNQVMGNIVYYIKAYNSAGREFNTTTYYMPVADFYLEPQTNALTVYRTKNTVLNVRLQPVNNFHQPLELSISGNPSGLSVSFSTNPASVGSTVSLNFTATATASNGTYPVTVVAAYTTSQATQVTKGTIVDVTVADFQAAITPSESALPGTTATFTMTLTLQKGFVAPVSITSISGLPQGATYAWTTNNPTILAGGPGTTTVTLQVKLPALVEAGTYPIVIVLSGGGVIHTLTTQIIVR